MQLADVHFRSHARKDGFFFAWRIVLSTKTGRRSLYGTTSKILSRQHGSGLNNEFSIFSCKQCLEEALEKNVAMNKGPSSLVGTVFSFSIERTPN